MRTVNMRQDDKYVEVEEKESPGMIQQIVSKYLPYWPLLIVFGFLSLAGAYAYLRYATPIYEATATLIIKDDNKKAQDSKIMQDMSAIAAQKDIDNEIDVLKSRALMEGVVKKLCLYAPMSRKGNIKANDAYLLSPITIEAQNPDSIEQVEEVDFNYDKNTQTVLINGKDKYPINQFVTTPYGVLKFAPNKYYKPFLESGKQLSFSLDDPRNVALGIAKGLAVTGTKSALIDLSYKDPIPTRAVNILNTLINIYEEKSIEDKNSEARKTLSFIDEQLGLLKRDIDSTQKKVEQFRSGGNAVDPAGQTGIAMAGQATAAQELDKVSTQMKVLDEVEKYVTSKSAQGGMVPSTLGINDPTLATLANKLYTSELEYEKLKKTTGENNPRVLALADEISRMRPSLLDNIQSQKANLSSTRQSLYASSGTYRAQLSTMPGKETKLMEISRELQTKNENYNYLLSNKQKAELSLASALSGYKVVDSALAGKFPVSPKRIMIYILAVMAALGLFVATIIVKDSFTGKIKYRNEIEKMTSIPIIGEIAFEKTNSPLVIEKGTRSFVAEEFRKLRISLSFLGIDAAHKKLLLTSSISGEGKSFIAANLAVSISLTGKKVVLVDLDLNNPSLSKMLNVNYEDGVTEYLNGEKSAEEVINKLDTHENLYFISAGSLPENPTELLANGKVKPLIDYLESNFDMVIIDTSPAVLVTDAYILSGMCDATLYVIRHNYSPKMLIRRIDESNQINPIHNPAIVFNGVKTRGVFKNNYGYGYDYVYGNKERGRKTKKAS
jgi:capsular exopolysaccharide synthesis family protein